MNASVVSATKNMRGPSNMAPLLWTIRALSKIYGNEKKKAYHSLFKSINKIKNKMGAVHHAMSAEKKRYPAKEKPVGRSRP